MPTTPMTNAELAKECLMMDACVLHDAELVNEYDFGMRDATLYKYSCGCCVVAGDGIASTHHTSYDSAQGRARLTVADHAVRYA